MDKLIHTALNSMHAARLKQATSAQNLSNAQVPGFRGDEIGGRFGSIYLSADNQLETRVFSKKSEPGLFSDEQGELRLTGQQTDVAFEGDGYFMVENQFGDLGMSRRGDFAISSDGTLVNRSGELSGAIEYKHNDNYLRFRTNATERIRITNDGITFNGDTAAANALDDYEEGSYTPTFISSGASFTYNHQYGYYQKVGNTVHVSFYITLHPSLTTVSGTTSNTLHVSVPFTATSATRYEAACCFSMVYKFNLNASAVDDIPLTGRLYSGDNKIDLLAQFDDDAGYAYTAVKANQNGCGLAGSITYRVS